jgi:hypothetical protein
MASEVAKEDVNYHKVMLAVSNDGALEPRMLRVDTSTNRLLVDVGSVTIDTTGLATSAGQTTGNNTLTSIAGYVDGIETLLTAIDGHVDGLEASTASIDTKTPALGQALAAASTPVVLTAAQISTLTPPAAITNYALETGGNLATAVASLSVMDDWDETDRAKVNLIVGQAGIAAGSGVDGVTVPRVTLATNVALPAGTNAIGKLAANSGVDIGDIDVTSIVPGTGATNLGKAEDAVHNSGDTGVFMLGVGNVAQSTLAADGDYIAIAVDTKGNSMVGGNIAHDGVDAGNPILQGMRAIAHGANPTAVAAADRTVAYSNRAGIPFVIGGHMNSITIEAAYTGAQTDTAIVTIATGLKIVVTAIAVICDKANTVNVGYRVGFGTANTPTTTGVVSTHPGVAAGSGVVEGNGGGILGIGADNEDLRITCTVPTTGSIRVKVTYYTIET